MERKTCPGYFQDIFQSKFHNKLEQIYQISSKFVLEIARTPNSKWQNILSCLCIAAITKLVLSTNVMINQSNLLKSPPKCLGNCKDNLMSLTRKSPLYICIWSPNEATSSPTMEMGREILARQANRAPVLVAHLQVTNTCRSKHVKLQKNFALLPYVKIHLQNTPKRPPFCMETVHGRIIV